jgi:hypothetical protein
LQRFTLILGIVLMSSVGRPLRAAQPAGHAEISRPAEGDSVADVVTILGSASSATFDRYELSFGYDPDPTDTWFPIGEPVSTQVSFGRLGLWDTSRITDGTYALRLTVTLEDGSVIEDVVSGIEVRNTSSGPLSSVSGTASASVVPGITGPIAGSGTPIAQPGATAVSPRTEPSARGRGIPVGGVVLAGAVAGVLSLLGLGAYVLIRRDMRQRWGAIRSRSLHTGSRADDDRGGRPR